MRSLPQEKAKKYLSGWPDFFAGDFDSLWTIGHKLHGSGGGFGLDFITETGARLEKAAKARDKDALKAEAAGLKDFLDSLEIEFVPLD